MSKRRWRLAQAIEWRWWKRYLGSKDREEYLQWKRGYWHDLLHLLQLDIPDGSSVLDLGCGPAGIFLALPDAEVTAVDPLLERYDQLGLLEPERFSNVRWVSLPIEEWQPDRNYDYVCCLNVLNHVRDLSAALRRLHSVGRPDTTYLLSIDAHRHSWLKPLFRAMPGDVLHPHQYDLSGYLQLLQDHGFEVLRKHRHRQGRIFDYWMLICKHTAR